MTNKERVLAVYPGATCASEPGRIAYTPRKAGKTSYVVRDADGDILGEAVMGTAAQAWADAAEYLDAPD